MAKRTKLTAPSAAELEKLDADFRSENRVRPNPATAPIASVAAETALSSDVEPAQQKLNRLDAEKLREAEEQGRLIVNIPLDQINEMAMMRDRTVIIESDLIELQNSMMVKGLRLPIEVYKTEDGYGLISGYRRLLAARRIVELGLTDSKWQTIKAIVRPERDVASQMIAMVEENEVRANLSHFERGRIAVIAANSEVFTNVEEAINKLFETASAAKRSKVKSFAEVFEYLGDLLEFPHHLSERRGLQLFQALRNGGEQRLRQALEDGPFKTPEEEWAALEVVVGQILDNNPVSAPRRGRPKAPPQAGWDGDMLHLSSGITLRKEHDGHGYMIRILGKGITGDLLDRLIDEVRYKLEKPKN